MILLVVHLSGGFRPPHAFRESGIQRLGILMADGRNVSVTEAFPALHILNGRWKSPSRHERIVEAHYQAGGRHHLL
jgi:L-arabinose isomerase